MKKYSKNIVIALSCFLVVIVLNFLLPRLLPGDPVAYLTGMAEEEMTGAQYSYYREALHLDESGIVQFGYYLKSILNGTLGYSFKKEAIVSALIFERLGYTLQITLPSVVLSTLIGLFWGLYCGSKKGGFADGVSTSALIVVNSVPTFLLALVFIIAFCFKQRWFPYTGLNSSGVPAGTPAYREAAEAFSLALRIKPDDLEALRLRAGRYLSTLQTGKAYADLLRCLTLGGDALDIKYRLGLSDYFAGNFSRAMQHFEACMPLADDEMGIAVIYWHTLCAYRCVASAGLLAAYHTGTEVGHHFAYEKAVRVFSKSCAANDMLEELDSESEDLHYTITAYGLSLFLRQTGREAEGGILFENVIERNSFWPCYAYLAAWNDKNGGGESVQS